METPPSRGCKAVQSPCDARDAAYECSKATGGKALNTDAEEWRGKPSRAARRTSAGRRGASPDSCLTHHSSRRSPDSNGSCEHAGDDHLGMSPMQVRGAARCGFGRSTSRCEVWVAEQAVE